MLPHTTESPPNRTVLRPTFRTFSSGRVSRLEFRDVSMSHEFYFCRIDKQSNEVTGVACGVLQAGSPTKLSREDYAANCGPTKGDRVRLGDTCLLARVETDHNHYGDELKFGGGKTFREGMGQVAQL